VADKKTILVTGANGQLGKELQTAATFYPQYNFLFAGREILAIENDAAVKKYFTDHTIDFCINCAAYTAVDKAEAETDQAFVINATATGYLAAACKAHHAVFIHVSTDYVFDGNGTQPYKESDTTNPVSVYGQSKLKGESLALENNADAIIIRTSWVYSSFGNNFVKTMLRLMKERDSINVVNDQCGRPTYAADLANAILKIVEQKSKGKSQNSKNDLIGNIFNYSNDGDVITWYDFAVAIKELSGSKCMVNPIPTTQYPTPAKRPQYSVLDTAKIKATFNIQIPQWKDSLQQCLSLL
jgi:dTDP-4-dehydrorhamnose reductase